MELSKVMAWKKVSSIHGSAGWRKAAMVVCNEKFAQKNFVEQRLSSTTSRDMKIHFVNLCSSVRNDFDIRLPSIIMLKQAIVYIIVIKPCSSI